MTILAFNYDSTCSVKLAKLINYCYINVQYSKRSKNKRIVHTPCKYITWYYNKHGLSSNLLSVYIDLIQWNFTICIIWLFIKTNGTHFRWNCVLQWHPSHFTFRQFVKIIKCSPSERDRESRKVIAEKFWCQRLHVPRTCVSYVSMWMCLKPVHIHCLVSIWKVSLWNDELTFTNSLSCSLNSFSPSILYIFLEWVSLHCVNWSLSFPAPQICPAGLPGATLHLPGRRLQTAGVGPAGVSLQPPGHPPKGPLPQRGPHSPALPTPVSTHHELHPAQEWGSPKPTGTGDSQSNRTVIPECSCSCSRSFRRLG